METPCRTGLSGPEQPRSRSAAAADAPSGVNWRGVLFTYGLCGVAVAAAFWVFVRNHPPGEPPPPRPRMSFWEFLRDLLRRLWLLARNRNMCLFGAAQFGVNIGWAFVVTLLPSYLNQSFGVPLEKRGEMQSVVLYVGCTGMLLGGVVTDALRQRLGPRLGPPWRLREADGLSAMAEAPELGCHEGGGCAGQRR